jgi:hypothetical protein
VKHRFGNVIITTSAEWRDVTADLHQTDVPFTLARAEGLGALQFSIAFYEAGASPAVTIENLKSLLVDFARSRELGRGFDSVERANPLLTRAVSFTSAKNFVRVWYCSNGRDIVLATYVCEAGYEAAELPECEAIITNLQFDPRDDLRPHN